MLLLSMEVSQPAFLPPTGSNISSSTYLSRLQAYSLVGHRRRRTPIIKKKKKKKKIFFKKKKKKKKKKIFQKKKKKKKNFFFKTKKKGNNCAPLAAAAHTHHEKYIYIYIFFKKYIYTWSPQIRTTLVTPLVRILGFSEFQIPI